MSSKNSRNNIAFGNTSSPVGREHRALTHRLTFLAERLVPWIRKVRQSPPARAGVGGKSFTRAFPRLLPGNCWAEPPALCPRPWLGDRTFQKGRDAKNSNDRGGQRAQHEALPRPVGSLRLPPHRPARRLTGARSRSQPRA